MILHPPSRILMTADAMGGVWTYAIELITALQEEGIEVVLAVMGNRPQAEQLRELSKLKNVILRESDFKLEWMHGCWHDVARAGDWLLELEEIFQPNIVHLNGYVHAAMPFTAPTVVVGHSCVLSWWKAVKRCEPPQFLGLYRAAVKQGLMAADVVVTPSTAMMGALQSIYGFVRRPTVIPNGRSCREPISTVEKEPLVISGGRIWDEGKNITQLIEAAALLDWPLVLAGDLVSPEGGDLDPSQNVRALGFLAGGALELWLGRASIFALPAKYEPFGLLPLEAALQRCALVLGDIPSLREVWEDSALYVDPDDHDAIAAAINDLVHNSLLRDRMAEKASQRAREFSVDRMAGAYLQVYSELVGQQVYSRQLAEVLACV